MITWKIIQAFVTALQDIAIANGYQTDLGTEVQDEPASVPDDSPSLLVAMTDIQANSDLTISERQREATVQIEASIPTDYSNARQNAHTALADVERALIRQTCLAPAGVRSVRLGSANITPLEDGSRAILATWTVDIKYVVPTT